MRFVKNILLPFAIALTFAACQGSTDAVGDRIDEARDAISADDYATAQSISDEIIKNGIDNITETNLGRLAVIYMQLSDHDRYEENVAVATECVRQAMKISADSLATFSNGLTPDEQVHFTLVRRIAGGIDNPVDLTQEDIADEDGAHEDGAH